MTRQEKLNEAWCKYMGKCSTEIMQALAFALRWCDKHPNWISVNDELPIDGQVVLVTTTRGYVRMYVYEGGKFIDFIGAEKRGVILDADTQTTRKTFQYGKDWKGGEE